MLQLAQDLSLDPTKIAQDLASAESVQQVLAICVGVLLIAIVFLVWDRLKKEKEHATREDNLRVHYEDRLDRERVEQKAILTDLHKTLREIADLAEE